MGKKEETIEVEGTITQSLPNAMFRVQVDSNSNKQEMKGKEILCTLSGKMRIYKIRVMPGDKVKVELTPYDQRRGRIIFRYK